MEVQSKTESEAEMTKDITYRGFTDAATGQTIYVNPYTVRFRGAGRPSHHVRLFRNTHSDRNR
jgi:uncharacterized iron-regulated membrane protein